VQPEPVAHDDTEEHGAAAAHRPEHVRVLGFARPDQPAVGHHHLDRLDVVAGEAPRAGVPAEPAAEQVAAQADRVAVSDREGEALRGERVCQRSVLRRRLHLGDARLGVDRDPVERPEVEHDALLQRDAREVVAAAARLILSPCRAA
jgi:hypothetical protein